MTNFVTSDPHLITDKLLGFLVVFDQRVLVRRQFRLSACYYLSILLVRLAALYEKLALCQRFCCVVLSSTVCVALPRPDQVSYSTSSSDKDATQYSTALPTCQKDKTIYFADCYPAYVSVQSTDIQYMDASFNWRIPLRPFLGTIGKAPQMFI